MHYPSRHCLVAVLVLRWMCRPVPGPHIQEGIIMAGHNEQAEHTKAEHTHGDNCGHDTMEHGDHVDYLHDGHRHSEHGDHYDECQETSA